MDKGPPGNYRGSVARCVLKARLPRPKPEGDNWGQVVTEAYPGCGIRAEIDPINLNRDTRHPLTNGDWRTRHHGRTGTPISCRFDCFIIHRLGLKK
ncbi:hypothetical protein CEXT_177101 [Caerostris extrusa]|uniref:Uncharacterized protein n=1 Tax=Caerostris extrusa TaxID=172846 RepID=A0AAV4RBA0_CAEEX|nr:hypothetical protein CEXT_177101 [Caerostris extrusa]